MTATEVRPARTMAGRGEPDQVVPWATVVPLAVALALGASFWTVALRGAVGAIERTQEPFASWVLESAELLPAVAFAVLAALVLARRRFGPLPSRPRALASLALLVAGSGALVGSGWLAASAAIDYRLQAERIAMMHTVDGICDATCVTQQHASLVLQERAVEWGSAIMVASNVVLVAWVLAVAGGDVRLGRVAKRAPARRDGDLRRLLAAGLAGSGLVHLAVVPEHLVEWAEAGVFFAVLAVVQLAAAAVVLARPLRPVLLTAALVSAATLGLWAYSRSLGLPFGPDAGAAEPLGTADLATSLLELGTLAAALALLRAVPWLRRPAMSGDARRLALLAVAAVTAIGLAGTGLG